MLHKNINTNMTMMTSLNDDTKILTETDNKYKYKATNIIMMTYLPIEKPDDTEHQNKYKEGGGESGTAKRIT